MLWVTLPKGCQPLPQRDHLVPLDNLVGIEDELLLPGSRTGSRVQNREHQVALGNDSQARLAHGAQELGRQLAMHATLRPRDDLVQIEEGGEMVRVRMTIS